MVGQNMSTHMQKQDIKISFRLLSWLFLSLSGINEITIFAESMNENIS